MSICGAGTFGHLKIVEELLSEAVDLGPIGSEFLSSVVSKLRIGVQLDAAQKAKLEEMYDDYLGDPADGVDF